jgi:hypothetical protein
MLKKVISLLLILLLFSFGIIEAQNIKVKGLYVDGFSDILGNTGKEDSLLLFAQKLGINYLTLYELHIVNKNTDLTKVSTAAPLTNFIKKAKMQYKMHIGGCGENFKFFKNVLGVYNQQHSDTLEKIDVYNLEFEFWNSVPNGYLCTTYLNASGYSCDTSGAFAFYKKELFSIDSLANLQGAISETYVGWFNGGQANQISNICDRILLHAYVKTDATVFSYSKQRLIYFGNAPRKATILPLFAADGLNCIMPGGGEFMGAWLASNPEQKAFNTYLSDFNSATGSWKNNIVLDGYQWFSYKCLQQNYTYSIPTFVKKMEQEFSIKVINTENDQLILLVNSPSLYDGEIILTDILGKTILHQYVFIEKGSQQISLPPIEMSPGICILQFITNGNLLFVTKIKK